MCFLFKARTAGFNLFNQKNSNTKKVLPYKCSIYELLIAFNCRIVFGDLVGSKIWLLAVLLKLFNYF
jgi:hypothetical protein